MSQPDVHTSSLIPAEIIPRLRAAAAQFAARHEEPNPAAILAVAATHMAAVKLVFKGTLIPDSRNAYAVVMTGRFASYRGGRHAYPPYEYLPHIGSALVVVFDAETLDPMDSRLGDNDDPALLSRLGPVTLLTGQQPG